MFKVLVDKKIVEVEELKPCYTCAHCVLLRGGPWCERPVVFQEEEVYSFLTGKKYDVPYRLYSSTCRDERVVGECGIEGKFWE